ncbi:hypothetical protein HDU88_006974 [Geranomyces variabilis]|nr:hypothetical protein HDU88_006974 [Geranomyces variabilis]
MRREQERDRDRGGDSYRGPGAPGWGRGGGRERGAGGPRDRDADRPPFARAGPGDRDRGSPPPLRDRERPPPDWSNRRDSRDTIRDRERDREFDRPRHDRGDLRGRERDRPGTSLLGLRDQRDAFRGSRDTIRDHYGGPRDRDGAESDFGDRDRADHDRRRAPLPHRSPPLTSYAQHLSVGGHGRGSRLEIRSLRDPSPVARPAGPGPGWRSPPLHPERVPPARSEARGEPERYSEPASLPTYARESGELREDSRGSNYPPPRSSRGHSSSYASPVRSDGVNRTSSAANTPYSAPPREERSYPSQQQWHANETPVRPGPDLTPHPPQTPNWLSSSGPHSHHGSNWRSADRQPDRDWHPSPSVGGGGRSSSPPPPNRAQAHNQQQQQQPHTPAFRRPPPPQFQDPRDFALGGGPIRAPPPSSSLAAASPRHQPYAPHPVHTGFPAQPAGHRTPAPPRSIDVNRLPKALQVAYLQKVDKDADRRAEELKRARADSARIRADGRKIRFDLWLSDWEVSKFERQLETIIGQIEECEKSVEAMKTA